MQKLHIFFYFCSRMMTIKVVRHLNDRIQRFYDSRTKSKEEQMQLTVYLFSVMLAIGGLTIHLAGLFGLPDARLFAISGVYTALPVAVTIAYFQKKLSLIHAFFIYGVGAQTIQSFRMVMLSHWYPSGGDEAMLGNLIVSYTIILYVTMGYLATAPIITLLFEAAITYICFFTDTALISVGRWFVFSFIEIVTCVFAVISQHAIHGMQTETTDCKIFNSNLLILLGINEKDARRLIRINQEEKGHKRTFQYYFGKVDGKRRSTIKDALVSIEAMQKLKNRDLAGRFPSLSETELTVCRFVMQGCTMNEIAEKLNKSKSNIGSVRANIRRKLNLTIEQDLREFLLS